MILGEGIIPSKEPIKEISNDELYKLMNELIETNNNLLISNNELSKKNEDLEKNLIKQKNDFLMFKKHFNKYKKLNDEIIDSYYGQFKTLLLYQEFKPKGLLKLNNILTQELLDFVVNICKKYDLEYWLDFGLLLGAVRHGSFIPWDDDADIGMIRKDYNVLLEVIEYEITNHGLKDYIVISLNINEHKKLPMLQLLYNAGIPGVILGGLDIFPYDYIGNIDNCNVETFIKVRKSVNQKNEAGTPINIALNEYFEEFDISYDKKNHILPGIEGPFAYFKGYDFNIWDADVIYPLKQISFNDKYYTCPNNFDQHLTKIYGEYNTIPKIIHHHHRRFERLLKKGNAYDLYDEHISKLRKANKSF